MDVRIETLEPQLKASESRIEALEAGMGANDSNHRIAILKTKHAAAREKLNELKDEGIENWDLFKADIWIAWNELENAFRDFEKSTLTEKRK